MMRLLSNIYIIGLYLLFLFYVADQQIPKYADVRPSAALIGAIEPQKVPSLETDRHFIMESQPLELMDVKLWYLLGTAKIFTIGRHKIVLSCVATEYSPLYDMRKETTKFDQASRK